MIAAPEPNLTSRPYRGVSVADVDITLDAAGIKAFLVGREVYRRTEFLILRNGDDAALVQVAKDSLGPLFSPATDVRVLAEPDRLLWVHSPVTDCGNASAVCRAALAARQPGIDAYVVQGLFEHVNFIWRPEALAVRVTEVVPPLPPKLVAQVEQAIAFDEDLPPIQVVPDVVELSALVAEAGGNGRPFLLPCRGSGFEADAPIDFLDTRPADQQPWILVGCERSAQFYRHFYGAEPDRVDLCPRQRRPGVDAPASLTKCCLIERGVEFDAGARRATVPWGANLDEVRLALRLLAGLTAPDEPVPYGPDDSPAARAARISSP